MYCTAVHCTVMCNVISSREQPTSSVGVGLVVRQQRRGQAGVVAIVDPIEGVRQLLGLVSWDEGGRPPVKDRPGHAGGGRDLLEPGRENQRRTSEIAASEGQGLGLDGGLHTGVDLLEPGGGVQTSWNGDNNYRVLRGCECQNKRPVSWFVGLRWGSVVSYWRMSESVIWADLLRADTGPVTGECDICVTFVTRVMNSWQRRYSREEFLLEESL